MFYKMSLRDQSKREKRCKERNPLHGKEATTSTPTRQETNTMSTVCCRIFSPGRLSHQDEQEVARELLNHVGFRLLITILLSATKFLLGYI